MLKLGLKIPLLTKTIFMKNLSLLLLFVSSLAFSQSPWTQKKGKFYTQFSFSTISDYDTLFGDPEKTTERKITDNTAQFYVEYGITDNLTLIVNVPYKMIKTGELVTANNNPVTKEASKNVLGNASIGIKRVFYKRKWIISGQLTAQKSVTEFDNASGIRGGYESYIFTPLFIFGKGSEKTYMQFFTGADFFVNNYSSRFKVGGEAGFKLLKRLWVAGFIDVAMSLKNGKYLVPPSNVLTGLYVDNQEYGAFGGKIIGEFSKNFGVTAAFGGAFFGNNVAKKAALSAGVFAKF